MKLLFLISILCVALLPRAAAAQDEAPTQPVEPPTVVVSGDEAVETVEPSDDAVTLAVRADAVDPEVLRRALERDLGVRVELVRDDGARVTVDMMNDGVVRLRVRRDDDELERQTPASDDPTRNAAAVSLIISNLVRDESGEILAMLRIAPDVELDQEPEEVGAPEVEEPVAEEPPVEEPAEQLATPEPPPQPERERIPFGIDFAPGLGMSTAFGTDARRAISLGVIGALHGGIDGFGASSVIDIGDGDVAGVQLAGVGAFATGDVRGLQGSGVLSLADTVRGLQLSGVLGIATGGVRGVQGSVVGVSGGEVRGAQLGVLGINGGVNGFQASVVGVAGGDVRGAQAGVVNVAGDVYGAQLGVINIAGGRVHGAQIGVINVSEDADAAIGLVNVHARGRTQLRLTLDTNGLIDANLVHGGRYTHMLLRVGAIPFLGQPKAALAIGLGARAPIADGFHLDFEVLGGALLDEDGFTSAPDMLYEARVLAGIELIDELALTVGIAYRMHLTRDSASEAEMGSPVLEHTIVDDNDLLLRGWPSIIAGVEIF